MNEVKTSEFGTQRYIPYQNGYFDVQFISLRGITVCELDASERLVD